MQHRFAAKLFAAAKTLGIHTALDTNGYDGDLLTDAALDTINLVLLDLKAWDPERHRQITGMEVGPTLDFARRLAERGKPLWVRFVLVPGHTDSPDEIAAIAAFAASLGNVKRVDVLPFHQMGRFKWKALGIRYQLDDVQPPSAAAIQQATSAFAAAGLTVY